MNKKLAAIVFIILIGNTISCGSKKAVPDEADTYDIIEVIPPTRAEQTIKSLALAYPDIIEKAEFHNDDWAVFMRGIWYFYAGGRILPENQLENAANFRSYQFYNYPEELPPWAERTAEDANRFSNWTTTRSQSQIRRSSFFLDALWQASNRAETERRLVRISFLGRPTRVHQYIQGRMALIETEIMSLAAANAQIKTWIDSLGTLEGYGWRNIADTQSRSYHSYGLAVDLLPRNLAGRQTYWLWTSQHRRDWWNVSYNERYHPPMQVIKIFESYGFIWGGKWPLFDTMHFEYRPEILIFNNMNVK